MTQSFEAAIQAFAPALPLAVGLSAFKTLHGTEYHLLMAASVAVLAPVVVIFFLAQRYFVEGIATTGVKG